MMLKNKIKNYFKLHGLILDSQALQQLVDFIDKLEDDKHLNVMDRIIVLILDMKLTKSIISLDIINQVFNVTQIDDSSFKVFQVINASEMPELDYNPDTEKYRVRKENGSKKLFLSKFVSSTAKQRMQLFSERQSLISQRLIRSKLFEISDNTDSSVEKSNVLRSIKYLLTSAGKEKISLVLAMLTKVDGQWFLEDSGGIMQLNLDKVQYHRGLVVEGCFVLAEGSFQDKIFKVTSLGMPPLEPAVNSRHSIDNHSNCFGGLPTTDSVKTLIKLQKLADKEISGKSILFASEVWLDQDIIQQKLKIMFAGYVDLKPTAFVFIGNVLSPDVNNSNMSPSDKVKLLSDSLKKLIMSFIHSRELAFNSHLVIIPGPNDPYPSFKNILPRLAFSPDILEGVFESIPGLIESEREQLKSRVILASNPCRMTIYNKELVIFRDNYSNKLFRHCLYIPKFDEEVPKSTPQNTDSQQLDCTFDYENQNNTSILNNTDACMEENSCNFDDSQIHILPNHTESKNFGNLESHMVWTLLSQSHLSPLPLHVSPVGWKLDHCLRLFPLPDLVVVSDPQATQFTKHANSCTFLNPPNFSKSHVQDAFQFKMYYPYNGEIQDCNLNI